MPTLVFTNGRNINGSNYQELSPIHLQQMASSATSGFGAEYTTAEHFLEQCGDGDMNDAVAELWDIVASDAPDQVLYDCWVYLADTANVYVAGTVTNTNVAMCQFSFDDQSKDGSNGALCEALQAAFDQKHKAWKAAQAE
ncbi:MAG TPA: hypothetical protein PLF40_09630 [Kofleriaceae bacterium]|nr:hypothetical protein [Kofleriaceae bacterium]